MSRRTELGPLQDMRHFARTAMQMFDEASPDALEGDTAVHFARRYLVMTVGDTGAVDLPKLVGQ